MAMQIAVNCKQHQAYQYGAFHEAFIHIGRYSRQRRWPFNASLRIDLCGGFMVVGMAMRISLD
jgi:hypothetical protein